MLPPDALKIYHIVHVDRLPSIVADGGLLCDAEIVRRAAADPEHDMGATIGIGIKPRRLNELTLTSGIDSGSVQNSTLGSGTPWICSLSAHADKESHSDHRTCILSDRRSSSEHFLIRYGIPENMALAVSFGRYDENLSEGPLFGQNRLECHFTHYRNRPDFYTNGPFALKTSPLRNTGIFVGSLKVAFILLAFLAVSVRLGQREQR